MEIHCKENLKTAFDFMREKGLPLDIIGGDDIANGNEKLTLGLMWIIISKFQVDDIILDGVSGKVCRRGCRSGPPSASMPSPLFVVGAFAIRNPTPRCVHGWNGARPVVAHPTGT